MSGVDRPVLRYHGGKYRLAPWLIEHFPPHECYVEPYAGAASVFMRKPRSPAECINDLDGRIMEVFRVLRDPELNARLRARLELTPYARAEFEAAYSEPCDDPVENVARLIVISFMGQGSQGTTRKWRTGFRCSLRNHDNKALPSHEWPTYLDSLPVFLERLQGVAIESAPALKIIERFDSTDTLFYIDPPYVASTRGKSRAKNGYRHEMSDTDHRKLSRLLHSLEGMVVISGYPSALYDSLYRDWVTDSCDAMADRGKPTVEQVWLNPACISASRQLRLLG